MGKTRDLFKKIRDTKGTFHAKMGSIIFNYYAENIMRNVELEEAQAGIMIAGRKINNLRYTDDITLMAKVKKN